MKEKRPPTYARIDPTVQRPSRGLMTVLAAAVSVCCGILIDRDDRLGLDDVPLRKAGESASIGAAWLLAARSFCLIAVVATCAFIYLDPKGITIVTPEAATVTLRRAARFTTFTVWCFALQGAYFAAAVAATVLCMRGGSPEDAADHHHPLAAVAWVLFEVSFTVALLVTVVVAFVLIPAGRKAGMDMSFMSSIPALIMHNANLAFMAFELVANGFGFEMRHAVFAVAWALAYVAFAWTNFRFGTGVFYYFFIDFRHPRSVGLHIGLVGILVLFFALGKVASDQLGR